MTRINVRAGFEIFLVSFVILFLELAAIRWFGAHVLYLTFFSNCVLLACFLGMSLGCLAGRQPFNYMAWTPPLLALALGVGLTMEAERGRLERVLDVGGQAAPEVVFFGTEYHVRELSRFAMPMEVVNGFFFVLIALVFVGPGQELGRALNRMPHRIGAYSLNLLGSAAGIAAFAAVSWLELTPFWWFLIVVWGIGYFVIVYPLVAGTWLRLGLIGCLGLTLGLAGRTSGAFQRDGMSGVHLWSPYYRIDYARHPDKRIFVNQIVHQGMVGIKDAFSPAYAYSLPHLLQRATGGAAFRDVLVIGAGTGNDVSRALHFGAEHVDAVDIDPVLARLGREDHPDRPYDDPRVAVHVDDGRNFLRRTERRYDLIVYALVDSLVLHSGYSNLRLENYLFTREAFEQARARLKPGGVLVMYNYFRQGWIIERLRQTLHEVFAREPILLTTPPQPVLQVEDSYRGFAVLVAGETPALQDWLGRQPRVVLSAERIVTRHADGGAANMGTDRNGILSHGGMEIALTQVESAAAETIPTDDWPFLYVRRPMLAELTLRGMAILLLLALGMVWAFLPAGRFTLASRGGVMFFLGAGFMLVETKAIVQFARLLGSTWAVNAAVLLGVLTLMICANAYYVVVRPRHAWPYFVGLFALLGAGWLFPAWSGDGWAVIGSLILQLAPIFFSSVLFAHYFAACEPDAALGMNIAGAMAGGVLENLSLLLGFQNLLLVAAGLYALALWPRSLRR